MKTVRLHDKFFKLFIPYSEISAAIDRVADEINHDYKDSPEPPILLCVLSGAIMFTGELMKRLNFDCTLSSIKLSSYEGTSSTGVVKEIMGLTSPVEDRDVIILEDIVDTGRTVHSLVDMLKKRGASSVRIATMLLKTEVYDGDIPLDYVALEIPNRFIVGFGLDYDEIGRNLPDIYVIDN